MSGMGCTACDLVDAFVTEESHRAHFKSDWHRYNLRRKQAEMMPVSEKQFIQRRRRAQMLLEAESRKEAEEADRIFYCDVCSKHFNSSSMLEQHLLSKKHALAVKKEPVRGEKITNIPQSPEQELATPIAPSLNSPKRVSFNLEKSTNVEPNVVIPSMGQEETSTQQPEGIKNGICLFCSHESPCGTAEGVMSHMFNEHGFFLPDQEYLHDLSGLKKYLGEKVGIGYLCLYCQKGFSSKQACQQHMIDSSHCKLLYDPAIDTCEYTDFYDFSSSWAGVDAGVDGTSLLASRRVRVDHNGELILEDGRLVGHRDYQRVYKQKVVTEDNREQVVANMSSIAERILGKEMASAFVQARLSDVPHSARLSAHGRSQTQRSKALMGLSPMQIQAVRKARTVAHKAITLQNHKFYKNRSKVQWNQNKLNVLNIGSNNKLGLSWKK
eukprot:GSMAST32.ASY1.ANO1.794.1 assembled CDS